MDHNWKEEVFKEQVVKVRMILETVSPLCTHSLNAVSIGEV